MNRETATARIERRNDTEQGAGDTEPAGRRIERFAFSPPFEKTKKAEIGLGPIDQQGEKNVRNNCSKQK